MPEPQPLFSIITVVYNAEPFVAECIRSVLDQTCPDFEQLVVDDNSSDGSWAVISQFTDPRIRAIRNTQNRGEYPNRQWAASQARGQYLIYIDGDDLMYPHALESLKYYTSRFPEAGMFFMREWDPRVLLPVKVSPEQIYQFEYLDRGIMGGNFTKVLFRRDALLSETFPSGIRTGDTYIQLKLSQRFAAAVIPDGFTWWRRRSGNATSKIFSDKRYLAEMVNYRVALLDEAPLSSGDKHLAKRYIYGQLLRQMVRMLSRAKFGELAYLLKNIPIPAAYWGSLFRKTKTNFFNSNSGDTPLREAPAP